MSEGSQKVVKDFKYKGRRCVVIQIKREGIPNLGRTFMKGVMDFNSPYCCGYVELKKKEILDSYDDYGISSDELTYQGNLKFGNPKEPHTDASDGKTYIGFDSAHSHNYENPKTQTPEFIAKTCKKIVDELESKNGN